MPFIALWVMFGAYGAGAVASVLGSRRARATRALGHLGLLVGAMAGTAVAVQGLAAGGSRVPARVGLPHLFPFADMSLVLDGLGAFFLLVVSVIALAAAIYGPAYLKAHPSSPPPVVAMGINLFVASMSLVLLAGDALTFLLAWEGMTLASYSLVLAEDSEANTHAGLVYIVIAHVGTALIMVSFLALGLRAGSLDFGALRASAAALSGAERSLLFFLAVLGLGAKAGVVPLHVWLPLAHPAAPSHVSALMSGVMLKVAIYGIVRFGLDLLAPASGPLPPSWGWTLLGLGSVSAVIGVLYALQQHDLKRLLAYHSVENVGIILMGLGMAMLLAHRGEAAEALAAIALAASLLHTFNHGAFKGLLFLCAGAVQTAAHTLNMEELGGLARRMPWTAFLFLVGAVAISGLPPLNGFVSEWMTFQALILGGAELRSGSGLAVIAAAAALALTGGLASACFVKAFGVTFLGRPRSGHAAEAREAAPSMRAAMALLAAACVAIGVFPGYAMAALEAPVALLLKGASLGAIVTVRGPLVLSASGSLGSGTSLSMTLAAALFAALALAVLGILALQRPDRRRLAPTWTCGMAPQSRFDYTPTAFAKSLRLIFATLYQSKRTVTRLTGATPYDLRSLHWKSEMVDLSQKHFYDRLQAGVTRAAHAVRRRSTGRIHYYIAYVLVTLLITLLFFGRG